VLRQSERHFIGRRRRSLNDPIVKSSIVTLIIRWVARTWVIASVGLVLLMFIGSGKVEGFNPAQFTSRDWVGLFFFPFGVGLGMIVAWRREGLGGSITVGSLAAFYAALRIMGGRFPGGPYFALVAAPGILFLVCGLLSARSLNYGVE
jgi:hypothetical protein